MALYKRTIDFLPVASDEELQEKQKVSKTGIYAAFLPVLAAFMWIIAILVGSNYVRELRSLDDTIVSKDAEISSYDSVRQKQTELILKVESLTEVVEKDFYPQKFFDDVENTIKTTGDAQAAVYSYVREGDGTFHIQGKANSYLDLAKIMVVFHLQKEFRDVQIESIHYDRVLDDVNFEVKFLYTD